MKLVPVDYSDDEKVNKALVKKGKARASVMLNCLLLIVLLRQEVKQAILL